MGDADNSIGAVRLRYALPAGHPLAYRCISLRNMDLGGMSGGMRRAMLWTFTPTSGQAEETVLVAEPRGVKMSMQMPPMGAMYFDTEKREEKGVRGGENEMAIAFVGKSTEATLRARGEQLKLKKSEALRGFAEQMGGAGPEFEAMWGDGLLQEALNEVFPVLPAASVRPGDSWTTTAKWNAADLGELIVSTTWTYEGTYMLDGRATAKLEGEIAIRAGEPAAKPRQDAAIGGDVRRQVREAKGRASARFDVEAGHMRTATVRMEISQTVTTTMPAHGIAPARLTAINTRTTVDDEIAFVPPDAPLDPSGLIKKPEMDRRTVKPSAPAG